jgi:predicted site-specific integrase-resolvase
VLGGVKMEDIINEAQLCEWLQITTVTAWRWRKKGMPYMGSKKSIRYSKKEVKKWLKEIEKMK